MPELYLTAEKRQNFIIPKLPLAASFIRKTLAEVPHATLNLNKEVKNNG